MTRDEAIAWLTEEKKARTILETDSLITQALNMAIEALNDRPHGEWLCRDRKPIEGMVYIECECSVCGHKVIFDTISVDNFCGRCGADMKGESHDKGRSNSDTQRHFMANGKC